MARATSRGTPRPRPRPREYDPDTETDPLIRKYITLPPPFSGKNDARVPGTSGDMYPVWSVYLNYLIAHGDVARTLAESYGDDLTPEHIEAVRRFAEFYPDEVMPYVEAALDEE
jgi:hypothetical protein